MLNGARGGGGVVADSNSRSKKSNVKIILKIYYFTNKLKIFLKIYYFQKKNLRFCLTHFLSLSLSLTS